MSGPIVRDVEPSEEKIAQFADYEEARLEQRYSLTTAFDEMAFCFSFGRQARHLYRYGVRGDCSSTLSHFRFCLSLKAKSSEDARSAMVAQERERAYQAASGPSSQDVWSIRRQPPSDFPPKDLAEAQTFG
ncbi:hypothetical protein BJ684DRAFT_15513 [Piptocephalis cylindrospora]|uniref:Uncharacterized protein n=1 Tax=Piptocephalis cylindrospora TaxID=1907219 RepID=A0A4P9Y560_9FUNG|nr:hypothetical protein BJ684DRAFT_15513 [Piptocephalis cylindrospora]|eukprot:RKP14148.1 hypothetical protein BJ684DRAFT_15513 [Piptocephalis cylindrospora]